MNVQILRVAGIRSKDPVVQAVLDGYSVRWDARHGWACNCIIEADELVCPHVNAMADLLDPRVLGGDQ